MDLIRVSQGGLETDLVLGKRVADHGWGLGYMLNQRCVNGPNPSIFGHGGLGGSFGFVDLENRIGYAYVMNHFDPTKANAALNGYVARRGAALGIATPVSEILVAMVKLLEESALNRRSG